MVNYEKGNRSGMEKVPKMREDREPGEGRVQRIWEPTLQV